jgi:poly-beta-1,6 N-acetyl-D-glucosamine synthase
MVAQINYIIVTISYALLGLLFIKVAFFLCTSHKHHKKQLRFIKNYKHSHKKFVSVIVPSYNEELTLANCIASLLKQDYEDYEIIIVDDGSKDKTYVIAQELCSLAPSKIRALTKVNGGKASALNYGINKAQGEIVVCIDADSIFVPNTISELVKPFNDEKVSAVGGNVRVANRKTILNRSQAMEYISGLTLQRRGMAHLNCMPVISGAIGAFRKDKLIEVGCYSSDTIVEDMDITIAIQKAGGKVEYTGHALAYTEAPEELSDFLKQRYRWTFGGFQVLKKYRKMMFSRKYGTLGLIGLPYFLIFPWVDVLISLLLMLSIIRLAFTGNLVNFLSFYFGMTMLQVILLTYSLIMDKEDKRLASVAILDSLWYNHLMSYTTIKAGINYLRGVNASWNKLTRLGKNYLNEQSVRTITSSAVSVNK